MTSTYKSSYIKKVDEYLKTCKDKWKEFHKTRGIKSDSYEQTIRVTLPKIEGFADYIGVSRKTVYNWQKEHEDFAEACDKILSAQKQRLIDNGLAGIYNPIITKVMLSHNHGMREGIDATTDGESLNAFNDEQIDRIAERIASRERGDGHSSGS